MPTPVDELVKAQGIGRVTVARLKSAGIEYLEDLAIFNPEEVEEIVGIDFERALKVVRAARRLIGWETGVYKGTEYAGMMASRDVFTSGLSGFDELMGGGFAVFDIYEFAGEFGSGKTQLCHQASVTVQLPPERGGLGGKVVYIDTEGTFSPGRIESIAKRFDVDEPLENVFVSRPINVDELEEFIVKSLPRLLKEDVRLVIIDSVIALYRAQFRGREWLARRQQRINYMLDWIKRLSRVYRLVSIITNQVISSPSAYGVALKLPAGGNIIAHASTHRFFLRRSGDKYIMEVLDSPRLPRKAAIEFVIREDGLYDV